MKQIEPFHIAQREQVKKRVQELSKRSDDIKSRIASTLKKLWVTERKLASISNLNVFADLKVRFPNFIEATELYEAHALGLAKLGLPFEVPPVLLSGDPGLGKTYYVSELARLISIPFYEISMATMTASFALSGSNLNWAESSPGFIATSLSDSNFANPIFLLDELDKSGTSNKYNPISPFYSLLERHSAKRFRDEALEIDLDASRIIWIATANYLENVPEPILSRMKIIDIKRPDQEQMKDVVNSIYDDLRTNKPYGELLDPSIHEDALGILVTKTPRESKLAIEEGCLKVILAERSILLPEDLPVTKKENHRVGFI